MSAPLTRLAALTVAAAVLASCDSSGGGAAKPRTSIAAPTSAPTEVAPPSPQTLAKDITLAFAGDVHFAGRTEKLLADPQTALGPIAAELGRADLAMVNLESAITQGGTPEPKQYHFRAPAKALTALKAAGIDVTTMANNHALDYGQSGLADTLAAIRSSGQPVVGIGKDKAAAYAPWVTTVRGTRIAFVGLSQIRERAPQWTARSDRPGIASGLDVPASVAAVKAARARADVVVVYLHWGKEGSACPTAAMKSLAKSLADAGADAIVSTHAHLMLGDGYLGHTYVQYGLGNFLWWWDNAYSNDTGVLTLTLHGRSVTKAELTPARISTRTGQPLVATGAEATRIRTKYAGLRACTGLGNTP
ncbi:MAG: hypothetical protein QOI35_494 [Cryptosporangiaceae bacterium]|nr:hypothetical protein [Cryptosporangiaceae bacterium]